MNKGVSYSMFYDILLQLREDYYSYGRIDDSNAKLDEMVKLICVSYSMALKGERFTLEYVRQVATDKYDDPNNIALALRKIFDEEIQGDLFLNGDGTNIFGSNPSLMIQETENEFAQKLISEIEKIDFVYLVENRSYSEFDLVNECFGHFVRDNFRNNKEDAQYMTPYEISEPILDIIFSDMEKTGFLNPESMRDFIVMDPTCGVGTLLIESSNHFTRYVEEQIFDPDQRNDIIRNFRNNGIIGQDKVDRMVRLSKINALLLGSNASNISEENSIIGTSRIDDYTGKVDLIFTNPPFGAEYNQKAINLFAFPILNESKFMSKTISSELLMLDKCINMLKPGGYLAIVLPDSVFASKGINSVYREAIIRNYNILGVVELPSVTFAQAGTRTNTCILILKKELPPVDGRMFMADCKDLGYVVKERSGVPVKIEHGKNEMPMIAKSITEKRKDSSNKIINEDPSVTLIDKTDYVGNILIPSFYSVTRLKTITGLRYYTEEGYEVTRLGDIVDFVSVGRKSFMVSEEIKHISVLHINANCTIAFDEVEKFSPITKGRVCHPGELIFSKINPRISRMAVIPEVEGRRFVCSNEFEIMQSKGIVGMYALCFLLKTDIVKKQIEDLTSGTSSSHSRIKREQLADILIPIPTNDETKKAVSQINDNIAKAIACIYSAEGIINREFEILNNLKGNGDNDNKEQSDQICLFNGT